MTETAERRRLRTSLAIQQSLQLPDNAIIRSSCCRDDVIRHCSGKMKANEGAQALEPGSAYTVEHQQERDILLRAALVKADMVDAQPTGVAFLCLEKA